MEEEASGEQTRREKSQTQNRARDQEVTEDNRSAQTQQNQHPPNPKTNEPMTGNLTRAPEQAHGSLLTQKRPQRSQKQRKKKEEKKETAETPRGQNEEQKKRKKG